ncbi:hypothetical protein [Psychrobacter sp. AOP7-C1-14]|jgi:hypothetical protein|uniref:hypothetical protein n=1 Tax=Psychrobacter sp. AOP7-C1-14 TaxID=3457640 RepID=UPI00402BC9E0
MSQYQTNGTVPPTRAQQQIERLQLILAERNQQLQAAEQKLTQTEITNKLARRNTRWFMALCTLLIVAMTVGGVA